MDKIFKYSKLAKINAKLKLQICSFSTINGNQRYDDDEKEEGVLSTSKTLFKYKNTIMGTFGTLILLSNGK